MATAPLYQSLTAASTPADIAAAYAQVVSGAGGDTQENQKVAIDYLTNLGIGQDVIGQAYNQFLQSAQVANTAGMGVQGIGVDTSLTALPQDNIASVFGGDADYYGDLDTSVTTNAGVTRDQVLAAYANNPLAELNPSEEAINYWLGQGLGSFDSTVDAVRAADPGLAAAIDASRASTETATDTTTGAANSTATNTAANTSNATTSTTTNTASTLTPEEIANTPGMGVGGIGVSGGGQNLTSKEKAKGIIYEQIKGQAGNLGTSKSFETGAASGGEGGFGSVDSVIWDMADRLADAGLTSIDQFGQGRFGTYYPEMAQSGFRGMELTPTGRWYSYPYGQSIDEGGSSSGIKEFIGAEQAAQLGLKPGNYPKSYAEMTSGESAFAQTVPVASGGALQYINKSTGEPLTSLTGYDGRGWSGTSAGDGQTIYNVQFDAATGLPIFYNQQKHGKDDYADLLKVLAIGTAIFAPQIGAALLPAGSSAAAALAVGSAVSGLIGSGVTSRLASRLAWLHILAVRLDRGRLVQQTPHWLETLQPT
jgi:hypothetical protein